MKQIVIRVGISLDCFAFYSLLSFKQHYGLHYFLKENAKNQHFFISTISKFLFEIQIFHQYWEKNDFEVWISVRILYFTLHMFKTMLCFVYNNDICVT